MKGWRHNRLVRHGLFWAAVLAACFLIRLPAYFFIGTKLALGELLLSQLPASLLATYPLLYGVLPQLLRGHGVRFVGLLAGWVVTSYLLANSMTALYTFVLAPRLFGQGPGRSFSWAEFDVSSYAWFVLLVTAGTATAIKVMNGWHDQRQRQQALLQRKLHTELQLLKAQLQPPFLFDTLRTLHVLTARKSPDAPAAVLHLAELLRYLLYEGPHDLVPLADEADMLRHYVALEQLRLGARVDVALSVSGTLGTHRIAPLLLLPLVENAFRHGTAAGLDCPWVSIDLLAKHNSIIFKIINSRAEAGASAPEPAAAGLNSLRQRLARLYPNRHALKIVAEPDSFLAVLSLHFTPVLASRKVAQG